jgi:hypothetical protein
MTSQQIAQKWIALLGIGFHPDTTGRDYTPFLPRAMQIAYEQDMDQLFQMELDPYAVILTEMEMAGVSHGSIL